MRERAGSSAIRRFGGRWGQLVLAVALVASPAYGEDDPPQTKRTRSKDRDKAKDDKKQAESKPDAKPEPPAAPPRKPGPDDAKVTALLDKIVQGPDTATRKAAIDELLAPGAPRSIDAIDDFLKRTHTVAIADRRTVLQSIKASVPDKTGKFPTPPRESAKSQQADDEFDWLAGLLAVDAATPGVGEVIADVAAIRILVASKEIRAAAMIFDTAFRPDTMLYRDECGRYLRKMEPYSIPAITRESQSTTVDRRRYATFQLERLDRQEPNKALAATAGDEAITLALLDVFRTTRHREAVHAVWTAVNADSPRVRAAAREAWMAYITGPPPPPAPKKKLQLPGGKLTKKPKPMWLTSRELADNELRKAANELLHEDYPLEDPSIDDYERTTKSVKIDLEETTKRLFKHLDDARATQELAQWTEAKAKADAGDLATATTMIDRLLVENPEHGQRVEMAKVFVTWGKQLEGKQQWALAAAAFSKAHGLDPKGAGATDALAAHHYTLGKSLEAAGKDGSPDFRRAIVLKPDYAPAKTAAAASSDSARPVWMLYAAGSAAALALLLFGAAMLRRRA